MSGDVDPNRRLHLPWSEGLEDQLNDAVRQVQHATAHHAVFVAVALLTMARGGQNQPTVREVAEFVHRTYACAPDAPPQRRWLEFKWSTWYRLASECADLLWVSGASIGQLVGLRGN